MGTKQVKRQFIIKKNGPLRTVGISHPKKSNIHRIPQNILFFDRIVVPSVKSGCHIKPARGTGNFGIILFSSGNRHKFTSMFNCASLVHPCTSVACCQTKFPVPLTALIRHPYFDERYHYSVKHGKDCFYQKKKNGLLRTVAFHHLKIKYASNITKFILS